MFEDRALRLLVTFGGAGVLHGDLTPECAEMTVMSIARGATRLERPRDPPG